MLRPQDIAELARRGHRYTISAGAGETLAVFTGFPLPEGLSPPCVDLLVRVPSLFPAVNPDMFWLAPSASRNDGAIIPATQVIETVADRTWQRWSRHLQPSEWRPDCDDLGTYLDIVSRCLRAAAA